MMSQKVSAEIAQALRDTAEELANEGEFPSDMRKVFVESYVSCLSQLNVELDRITDHIKNELSNLAMGVHSHPHVTLSHGEDVAVDFRKVALEMVRVICNLPLAESDAVAKAFKEVCASAVKSQKRMSVAMENPDGLDLN